ncbi:hypothetical protein Q767_07695 [Flavobacterium enshiense DK69]|uniref:Uncharacterized protein n=1 Tax=Flavobacterium enshiense DK69 TaxID=1107311 RepID=A0A0A2MUX2_9FLAO|nr:hypothetical protein Q767_07695 [Flavobacterium enshiense DK69]
MPKTIAEIINTGAEISLSNTKYLTREKLKRKDDNKIKTIVAYVFTLFEVISVFIIVLFLLVYDS